MRASTPQEIGIWPGPASPPRHPAPALFDQEVWLQQEDVASAYAVSAVTGAAVALLLLLAALG